MLPDALCSLYICLRCVYEARRLPQLHAEVATAVQLSSGFTDSAASTILYTKVIHILNKRRPVARIHNFVLTLHNPHTGIVWRLRDDRAENARFLEEMLPNKIVQPLPHGFCTIFVEILWRRRGDCTKTARLTCNLRASSIEFVLISLERVRRKSHDNRIQYKVTNDARKKRKENRRRTYRMATVANAN